MSDNRMVFSLTMTREECVIAATKIEPENAIAIIEYAHHHPDEEPVIDVRADEGRLVVEWRDLDAQRSTASTPYDPNFRTKEAAEHPEAETGVPPG